MKRFSDSKQLSYITLGVAIGVLVMKFIAYWLTGSVAMLSDALESIVNVAAALILLIALRIAVLPADDNHAYGHSKFEYLSVVIEGILIIMMAIVIVQQAWLKFNNPKPLESLGLGILFSIIASLINATLARILVHQGREQQSPALVADGMHLWADVITTASVIFAIILAKLTGWLWLDPALAIIVALHILMMGWRIIRESLAGLLDESLPSDQVERLKTTINNEMQAALEFHDLRTRKAGRHTFVTFHLVVPGDMNVSRAHDICDHLEEAIKKTIYGAISTIHIEPDHKAHHDHRGESD